MIGKHTNKHTLNIYNDQSSPLNEHSHPIPGIKTAIQREITKVVSIFSHESKENILGKNYVYLETMDTNDINIIDGH